MVVEIGGVQTHPDRHIWPASPPKHSRMPAVHQLDCAAPRNVLLCVAFGRGSRVPKNTGLQVSKKNERAWHRLASSPRPWAMHEPQEGFTPSHFDFLRCTQRCRVKQFERTCRARHILHALDIYRPRMVSCPLGITYAPEGVWWEVRAGVLYLYCVVIRL
jgi:hypothetical protein